jgi:hypothetical protein
MRKLFLFSSILFLALVTFQSCSKEAPSNAVSPLHTNIINVNVAPGATYMLQIDNTGGISKQASHFKISKTEVDDKTSEVIYKYTPSDGYSGTDEVVLSTVKAYTIATSGCSSHVSAANNTAYNVTFTTIKFNIGN